MDNKILDHLDKRIDKLEDKVDGLSDTVSRTEERVQMIYTLLEQHDAKAVRAFEEAKKAQDLADKAHARVDKIELFASLPIKWFKTVSIVAGAILAVVAVARLFWK
jgi:t-SNARE complex subunit (syntaxin)